MNWLNRHGNVYIFKHGKHSKVTNSLTTKNACIHVYTLCTHVESMTKISTHCDDFDERECDQTNQINE